MKSTLRIKSAFLGLVSLALALSGCGVLATTVNPSLLSTLGIDPATVEPSQGVVLLTFNNQSSFTADAFFAVSDNPADPTSNAFGVPISGVPAGQQRTMVVHCPIGVVTPGEPMADFTTDTAAVEVEDTGTGTLVNYTGTPLVSGRDFNCGDLIEMQLVQFGVTSGTGTTTANYGLQLIVHPG